MVELIGIVATLLVLGSMCCKTTSYRGSFWMRVINIAGSVIFVVYGILLPAVSTAILNVALIFVNITHLVFLIKGKKFAEEKNKKQEEK